MSYTDLKITDIDNNKEVASKINTIIDECLEVPNTISNSASATLLVKDAAGEFKQASKYSIVGEAKLLDWKSDKLGNVNHLVGVDTENQQYILSKINNVTSADEAALIRVNTLMSNIPGIGISSINIDALLSSVMFLPSNTISGTSPQNDLNTITDINLCIYITGNSVFYTKNIPENALNGFSYPTLIIENLSSFKREYKGNELTPDDGNISKPPFGSDERTMLQKLTIVDNAGVKIYYRTYMYNMIWGDWVKIKDTTETNNSIINLETQVTGQLDGANIADNTITSAKIAAKTIVAGDIADNTITATQIAANAITEAKIANNVVTTNKIKDGAIGTTKIVDGAVTSAKIAAKTIVAGDIADNTITATQIAANAITSSELADNAVDTAAIAAAAVTNAKLANSSVNASKIANLGVTTAKIANNAVTWDKLEQSTLPATLVGAIPANSGATSDGDVWVGTYGGSMVKRPMTTMATYVKSKITATDIVNLIKANPAIFRTALGLGSLATLNSINLSDTTKTTGILPSSKGGFDYQNYLG